MRTDAPASLEDEIMASLPAKRRKVFGHVRTFFKAKGYGFIAPEGGGPDIYVHHTDIAATAASVASDRRKRRARRKLEWKEGEDKGVYVLRVGDRVQFETVWDDAAARPRASLVETLID
ncbi:unnamed protein product [Vitrella brassicaformis CCMP3155]|uniref:CSD domain-containing protein n=1 Tax=Vitrella brassicaformis (strain CCMP3155) TaxID=1169540 RepID=A0A0G4G2T8_VITBC|nr:unnamed protein product [Vitrella brassicaformis CCMP3155]|eukprot:CEM22004.1 unnamed protein product [Vitrella brassicaformis CCMP3155]